MPFTLRADARRTDSARRLRAGRIFLAALLGASAAPLGAQGTSPPSSSQQAQPARPAQPVPSQSSVFGFVVDVFGKPIPDVEVYLAGTSRAARSDERGYWRIVNAQSGPAVVVARLLGYAPAVREVIIGAAPNDTLALALRRYPRTLSTFEIREQSEIVAANANIAAERMMQLRVGSGRLYTRDDILRVRPYSMAELVMGVPGVSVKRGQNTIIASITRSGVGSLTVQGEACQMQFYLDGSLVENEMVATINPLDLRSVEVYPQSVMLTGLPLRRERCGAIVMNSLRR